MCEWKIQDARQSRKELWLCWNGRFRMPVDYHVLSSYTDFQLQFAVSLRYKDKRSNQETNNFVRAAYFCSWPTLVDREQKAFIMNSLQLMPRQNENKFRNFCIFGLVFGKQSTLKTSKITQHMDKELASLEQAAVLYLSSIFSVGQNLLRTSNLIGFCWPEALLFQSWGSLLVVFGLGLSIFF